MAKASWEAVLGRTWHWKWGAGNLGILVWNGLSRFPGVPSIVSSLEKVFL